MAGVMARCRPVSSRRIATASAQGSRPEVSIQNLALVGSGDLELFPILGNHPACELETLALKDADDLGIAQRLPRIFLLDDLPDPLLDGDRRHRLAVGARDAAVEEIL